MKDILMNVLYILLTGAVTTLAGYLCALAKKQVSKIASSTQNEKIEGYINSATDVVLNSVLEVTQVYVDTLKKNGEFTDEAKNNAKEMAKNIAINLINNEGKQAINQVYGDFSAWIENMIEVKVKETK